MAVLQNTEMRTPKGKIIYVFIIAVLFIGVPIQFTPFCILVSNCFKTVTEISKMPPTFFPKEFVWTNIPAAIQRYDLVNNFKNTAILVLGVMAVQLPISMLAAFALAKLKPVFGNMILLLFIGTMMISGEALLFPNYMFAVQFKLVNNFAGFILLNSAWAYAIFLFKGFFSDLPDELIEAATIDGAGYGKIFTKIVLPLSKPVIAVMCLNTFNAVYGDYVQASLLMPDVKNWTLMVRLYYIKQGGADIAAQFAISFLLMIPNIIVFMFSQKHIVQGISMTGLKG